MGAFLLLGKEKPQCFRNENPDKKMSKRLDKTEKQAKN